MTKKILIIDDNPDIRGTTADLLHLAGFETYEAVDGVQGVYMAMSIRPDLVLCDLYMPRLDGHQVVTQLRACSETADTPFILLTGEVTVSTCFRNHNLGVDSSLMKPFDYVELMCAIERHLPVDALNV